MTAVSNLQTLHNGQWTTFSERRDDLFPGINGRVVAAPSLSVAPAVVAFSETWQGPNHGEQGGTFWVNRKTDEKKYQADDPGGAGGASGDTTSGDTSLSPASASHEQDTALKAYGAKYAAQAREKFGDAAHEKLTALVAKLKDAGDATPEGAKKLAAAKATLAALGETKPAGGETKPATSETKPTPAAPQYGLHPHATIPDRHVRYDNGKPTKIHDTRPGEANTPESHFITDERPGLVRDKEGEPLSLQLSANNSAEKDDQTNEAGMRFRVRGDYAKTTMAVRKEYDAYLYNLGEQAIDHGSDMIEDESFTPEQAKEIVEELRGHIEDAKGEIGEWYATALKGKFGDRFKEYEGTVESDIEDGFSDAQTHLDAMEAATDAEEFQEAAESFQSAIGDAMDHIDAEADKIHDQIDEEIDTETEAQEAERDRVIDELNELQGTSFEKAKKLAGEHNRMAKRNELPYRVTYDKDADEWRHEDFSEGAGQGAATFAEKGDKGEAGRWITIGGKECEDGKRHGGTPVYIENGRITKGHPSLTGRKLGSLDKPPEKSTKTQAGQTREDNRREKDYNRAVWSKKARAEGIQPKHLHDLAADFKANHDAHGEDVRKLLAEVKRDHPHLKATGLGADRGGDSAGVKNLDAISQSFAHRSEYNHLFGGVADWQGEEKDHSERLYDLLVAGAPEKMSQDEAYGQAMEHLRRHKAMVGNAVRPAKSKRREEEDAVPFNEYSLFDPAKHPRDDDGRWATKGHIQAARKQLAKGELKIHTGDATSHATGKPIKRWVELANGARIHPDELHRTKFGDDDEPYVSTDEKLTVTDGNGTRSVKSFATAVQHAAMTKGTATISGPHGYSVTLPGEEWKKVAGSGSQEKKEPVKWIDNPIGPGTSTSFGGYADGSRTRIGRNGEPIEGDIDGVEITTETRQLLPKVSKKTRQAIEDAFNDPDTRQAIDDAGIKGIHVADGSVNWRPKGWTMAHDRGVLMINPQTAERVAKRDQIRGKDRGVVGVIHHEAGHGLWAKASQEKRAAFVDAIKKHPEVMEQIAKEQRIDPPHNRWDDSEGSKEDYRIGEVHAELNAIRKYDPERFKALPDDVQNSVIGFGGEKKEKLSLTQNKTFHEWADAQDATELAKRAASPSQPLTELVSGKATDDFFAGKSAGQARLFGENEPPVAAAPPPA